MLIIEEYLGNYLSSTKLHSYMDVLEDSTYQVTQYSWNMYLAVHCTGSQPC